MNKPPPETIEELFSQVPSLQRIHWDASKRVQKVTADSRSVEPGGVFVACRGARMDGHDFLNEALLAGASVLVFEHLPDDLVIPSHVTAIQVENSSACMARLVNRYYGFPDRSLRLLGVTGTNGKTTVAYLLHHLLSFRTKTAYLGTLGYELPSRKMPALNTTPGPEILIPLLSEMRDEGVRHCSMEVSSHALEQCRIHGLMFDVALFTQLTQDHLDYHHNLENYFYAKRKLFSSSPPPRTSLVNADCPYGRRLLEEFPGAHSYALGRKADYYAKDIQVSFKESRFIFCYKGKEIPVRVRLPMRHNVANVLCVLGALDLAGYSPEDFLEKLEGVTGIPGRLENVNPEGDFDVFIDYAHTPDAFANVLSEARKLSPQRVLTVFGCGGDRDRQKRPLMARMACQHSDIVILTSDNPRSEEPDQILRDLRNGCRKNLDTCRIFETFDREAAIGQAITLAEPGDVVLVLGKGHEDYQILGDRKIPFDDRVVAREALKRKGRVFSS